MKKTSLFLVVVLAVLVSLSMAGCGSFGDVVNTAFSPEHWPDTLTLTGVISGYDRGVVAFSAPATGQINSNGTFVYSRTAPGTLGGFDVIADIFSAWPDAVPTNGAQFYLITALATDGPFSLGRAYTSSASRVSYGVRFIWVDREVQIRGSASPSTETPGEQGGAPTETTIEELNLTLLPGWNAVRVENDRRIVGGGGPNPRIEVIISAHLGNPVPASWTLRSPVEPEAAAPAAAPAPSAPAQPARFEPAPNQPSPVGTWSGDTTFNANGTGKWNDRDIRWERIGAGNQLTITIIGSDVGDYWYSIEGDTLMIVSNPDYPEFGSTYTRQR